MASDAYDDGASHDGVVSGINLTGVAASASGMTYCTRDEVAVELPGAVDETVASSRGEDAEDVDIDDKQASHEEDIIKLPGDIQYGDLVWAKVRGQPWWPGTLCSTLTVPASARQRLRKSNPGVNGLIVFFYGSREYALVTADNLNSFKAEYQRHTKRVRSKTLAAAIAEADQVNNGSLNVDPVTEWAQLLQLEALERAQEEHIRQDEKKTSVSKKRAASLSSKNKRRDSKGSTSKPATSKKRKRHVVNESVAYVASSATPEEQRSFRRRIAQILGLYPPGSRMQQLVFPP